MNNYALARLMASAGGIDSRKRLQKCVYFVQKAGCPLRAKYVLHLYGPYSQDVADATDVLSANGYLEESQTFNGCGGVQYAYTLAPSGAAKINEIGQRQGDASPTEEDEKLFKRLSRENLWKLELASTISYFRSDVGLPWATARKRTAAFKKVKEDASILREAEDLARSIIENKP
jgi:uncharacterized protein YwgA